MAFPQEILTERLRLRPPTLPDAEQIFTRYGCDPEVSRFMSWKPHESIDDTLEYLNRIVGDNAAGRSCGYLILCRETGELLGSVGGFIEKHRMTFGYCLAQDAWGKGYATEAARTFLKVIFSNPEIVRIQAYCDLENRASTRVLEKAGLSREGTLRRYMVMPNLSDTPRDMFSYAIVRDTV
jgi:RimJ/RimL family protein N-acetyltransferase